jgi:hypothetical protein
VGSDGLSSASPALQVQKRRKADPIKARRRKSLHPEWLDLLRTARIVSMRRLIVTVLTAACIFGTGSVVAIAQAQEMTQSTVPAAPPTPESSTKDKSAILLTIFLRHDQSKTLAEINDHLKQTGYYAKFPPAGIEVVSWYVMMGVGQVVTLRVPPDRLREVNRVIEDTAWGGYRTEFYPTYDYRQLAQQERRKAQ